MEFRDTLVMDDFGRKTADGYLISDVRAGRIGIQMYHGSEVGKPDMEVVRVYRPEEEVFKRDAMESFTNLPVTAGHPPELVKASNWKKYAVGFTGAEVARDGGFVRVPLALKDAATIAAVEAGARQLSFGYTCDLDFTAGKTADGQEYDAVQRNLRGNHLAIVVAGRAGHECRIGDEDHTTGVKDMDVKLQTVTVDGIPVQTTDVGATVIATLQKRVDDGVASAAKLVADHRTALADKDTEIADLRKQLGDKDKELGKKDGEIDTLKKEALDDDKLDKLVADRAAFLTSVRLVAGDGFDCKGPLKDVRRRVVAKIYGDARVQGKGDEYVEGLFDNLIEAAQKNGGHRSSSTGRDPIADHLGSTAGNSGGSIEQAHSEMVDHLTSAWQYPQGRPAARQ